MQTLVETSSPCGKAPKGNPISIANVWNALRYINSSVCYLTVKYRSFNTLDGYDVAEENCTRTAASLCACESEYLYKRGVLLTPFGPANS